MTIRRFVLPATLALSLLASISVRAGAQFSDGDFTTYSWTSLKLLDTTVGGAATFNAGEVAAGGASGGAFRSNSFSFNFNGTLTNQGIVIANLSTNVVYSPSVSGSIVNITSFSIAAAATSSIGAPVVSVGLLLLQNGVYFTNHFQGIGGYGNPVKESSPQLASAFVRVGSSGPLNPDFSTNGGTIEFGYIASAYQASGSATGVIGTIGADLYALSISNLPVAPQFTGQQATNGTNLLVSLNGLATGESITWYVSTNLTSWTVDNPPTSALDTNGTFIVTNSVYPLAPVWFLRAQVQ